MRAHDVLLTRMFNAGKSVNVTQANILSPLSTTNCLLTLFQPFSPCNFSWFVYLSASDAGLLVTKKQVLVGARLEPNIQL